MSALIWERKSEIGQLSSLLWQSSDWSYRAFVHIWWWKYAWILSHTWYDWVDPRTQASMELESVDWSQSRRNWSCLCQIDKRGLTRSRSLSSSERYRGGIWGLVTKRLSPSAMIDGLICCRHSKKFLSSNFSMIWCKKFVVGNNEGTSWFIGNALSGVAPEMFAGDVCRSQATIVGQSCTRICGSHEKGSKSSKYHVETLERRKEICILTSENITKATKISYKSSIYTAEIQL